MQTNIEELSSLTVTELAEAYRSGELTPLMVMEASLEHLAAINTSLNALYDIRAEAALAEARAATERWASQQPLSPWDGVPVTIKDSVNAKGMWWHHGSVLHGDGLLAEKDAPPVERLKEAGAIILAKCTMPDFGMSASGVSSLYGITRNPWNHAYSTGGSSSGAGASLASGIGWLSIGSDIAGSVRLPASHCALAALKPTQGLIAHTPASTVRSAGPMTRYAADLEPALRVLAGLHPDDRFSLPLVEPSHSVTSARIAVFDSFGEAVSQAAGLVKGTPLDEAIRETLKRAVAILKDDGFSLEEGQFEIELKELTTIDDSFRLRAWREYQHGLEEHQHGVPQALVNWLLPARHWGVDELGEQEKHIDGLVNRINQLFTTADILLTPVMPIVNFPAEQLGPNEATPLAHCGFTAPFNQSGHPAVVIHAGFDARGLPIGLQLVGKRLDDIRLIRLAARLEARLHERGHIHHEWPLDPRSAAHFHASE